jgi:hypothetical protein
MKKICAWCQETMRDEPGEGTMISHGICNRCAESVEKKIAISSFYSPVLALHGDRRAMRARNAEPASESAENVERITSRSRRVASGGTHP